jgi:hypothetical protein
VTDGFVVKIAGGGPEAGRHRSALASLPRHFRLVETGDADAVLATDELREGIENARVVVHPHPGDISRGPASAPVIVPALRFAPRLFAEPLVKRAGSSSYALIDSVICAEIGTRSAVRSALLEQMAALRALIGRPIRLTAFASAGDGYLALGATERRGDIITLTGVPAPLGRAELAVRAICQASRLEATISAETIARPSRIQLFGPNGVTQGPLIHQSSDRLTWLAVHEYLARAKTPPYGEPELRADLTEIDRHLTSSEGDEAGRHQP